MGFLGKLRGGGQLREVRRVTPEVARLRNALLSENDLFQGLGAHEMDEIADRLPMATARSGELIYAPGETARRSSS